MKKLILLLCVCLSIVMVSCKETTKETDANADTEMTQENGANKADLAMAAEYQCPMDCEEGKTYDKEGSCPVCKMDLKKVDKGDESATDDSESIEEGHDSN